MAANFFRTGLTVMFLLTTSCMSLDPYKYFQDQIQAEVGEKIDDAPFHSWRVRPELIFTAPLPNGNVEYHYGFENIRGICRFVLEVDPATHKIVDWRYDGQDKDKACFTIPKD